MNPLGHCLRRLEDLKDDSPKRHPSRSHLSAPNSGTYSTKRLNILPSSMLFSSLASAALENIEDNYSFLKVYSEKGSSRRGQCQEGTPSKRHFSGVTIKFLEKRTVSRGYSLEATLFQELLSSSSKRGQRQEGIPSKRRFSGV